MKLFRIFSLTRQFYLKKNSMSKFNFKNLFSSIFSEKIYFLFLLYFLRIKNIVLSGLLKIRLRPLFSINVISKPAFSRRKSRWRQFSLSDPAQWPTTERWYPSGIPSRTGSTARPAPARSQWRKWSSGCTYGPPPGWCR